MSEKIIAATKQSCEIRIENQGFDHKTGNREVYVYVDNTPISRNVSFRIDKIPLLNSYEVFLLSEDIMNKQFSETNFVQQKSLFTLDNSNALVTHVIHGSTQKCYLCWDIVGKKCIYVDTLGPVDKNNLIARIH